ncbi:MAG: VOC family protein [Euryarchaeota archaeon]|nr:VOC family protein [Euryarchaeota archaeon]
MPLGDPMGGETPESDIGRHLYIDAVMIPVSDLERALEFYIGILDFTISDDRRAEGRIELSLPEGGARIILHIYGKEEPGIWTGIVLATDSIYDLHKVLVDEGVDFTVKPERDRFGRLIVRILDFDGNEIEIIDCPPTEPRPRPKATEESMAGGRCPRRR